MAWIELIAALVSVAAVWLTALRRVVSCPIGILSVILYAWVFIAARLYSDALLQGVFGVMIVYSWVYWKRHLDAGDRVAIAPLARGYAALHVCLGVVCAVALGYVMQRWTNAALPWLDSALTAFSLVAQWWQARRHVAAWWLWIIVDVIYVGEYVYKRLDITSVLYAGFVVLAVIGLRQWRRAGRAAVAEAAN
jgi:nicotinamide mononucleotide transporter